MRQLPGSICVLCNQPIESVVEGRFCEGCQGAVHVACIDPPMDQELAGRCSVCGAAQEDDDEVRREEQRNKNQRPELTAANCPVSKVCPQCGHTEFKTRRPKKAMTFLYDRVCLSCGTRYSPPTPTWAAFVFIIAGLILCGISLLGLVGSMLSPNAGAVLGLVCYGLLGVFGALGLAQGIRSLSTPGKS